MCAERNRGFTLVEAVVLIVVVATAAVGVLMVFQNTVRASADPQVNKQALAIAEALLDEILLAPYDIGPGTGTRANFDDVRDYDGYTTAGGMRDIQNNPVPGLGAYNVNVTVVPAALNATTGGLPAVTDVLLVTVRVTGPLGFSVSLEGYRVKYNEP